MLYRAVLFTFAPTFVELVFVVGLLANRFSPMVAVLVGCTFALYVAWTLSMTQVSFGGKLSQHCRWWIVVVCVQSTRAAHRQSAGQTARQQVFKTSQ